MASLSVVVVVVIVDFGSWVLPLTLNCSLAPYPVVVVVDDCGSWVYTSL